MMERLRILAFSTFVLACVVQSPTVKAGESLLSTVLTPTEGAKEKTLQRQGRSYYDPRYGYGRPLYDRLEYDRPGRCGRCLDDRYDDRDDGYDRSNRDRYDDDRRGSHRPTYGNRFDRNKNDDDDDKRYNTDRRTGSKNVTDDENDSDKKRPYDDKDNKPSGSRRGSDRDRNRYDDRDRYRPDYYDRFLRDPYRERAPPYERPYYDDPYRERRPLFDRYPYPEDGYASRYDGYGGYGGYRRPVYDERFDRGYDDGYGGYGPGVGRGQHDSFRPWDETYRGQAGWDAGGRGYYFASGRPDAAPASAWGRPEYARPEASASGGWQNIGYGTGGTGGYRDSLEYRGFAYPQDSGYRQDLSTGYTRPSGWYNVGERRPYRDQSGVNQLDNKGTNPSRNSQNGYEQSYGQPSRQPTNYAQPSSYGQPSAYGQPNAYGQSSNYGQPNAYQPTGTSGYGSSSTTPGTSYLYQREDEQVTTKKVDETTKTPS